MRLFKKVIGYSILLSIFGGYFVVLAYSGGILAAGLTLIISVALFGLLWLAISLIMSRS